MSLSNFWKSNQKEVEAKHIQQVIGFAGKLKDGSAECEDFRNFLSVVPSTLLQRYAEDCLDDWKSDDKCFALQDVINEIGDRLGFEVEQGRYRGIQGEIGFDGIWRSPDGHSIITEVKTTSAYQINLDVIANYRKKLIAENKITEQKSSILLIVGRNDTGGLEAQVRGSRHAWDIRLISIDSLLRLMRLKEELDDPKIMEKIRRVLMPQEFTRVDGIIDLVFSAAEDVKHEEVPTDEEESGTKQPKFTPINFRDACAARVQTVLGQPLIKRSFAVFSSPDESTAVVCVNSRAYGKGEKSGYWFTFHDHQKDLIATAKQGYVALGCGSPDLILLIPATDFIPMLDGCNSATRLDRMYWHLHVYRDSTGFTLRLKKKMNPVPLNKYLLKN